MSIEHAAGVLCWRLARDGLEVLLVHRPRYDDWSWPKGKVKDGEPLPQAAVREAAEETGLDVVLGRPLGEVCYPLPNGRRKEVVYWAARVAGPHQDLAPEPAGPAVPADPADPADPVAEEAGAAVGERPPETDGVAWLPLKEAEALLTRRSDAAPLRTLAAYAERGELATAPVLVVRHGTSRPKDSWARPDADRPLVSAGRRQARGLVPLLACWHPQRLVSSPWRRCLETVAPFAETVGATVRTKGSLSEDGARRSPGRARRQLRRLLDRHQPALLCTHRPVLAVILAEVRDTAVPEASGAVPAKDPFLAPGEVLVAHVAVGVSPTRVVAVERHQPQA